MDGEEVAVVGLQGEEVVVAVWEGADEEGELIDVDIVIVYANESDGN